MLGVMKKTSDSIPFNAGAASRIMALSVFLALTLIMAATVFPVGIFAQGGLPPGGIIYYGSATANGEPIPDGHTIVARVGDYESSPVTVEDGKYESLSVSSANSGHAGRTVTFHLEDVQADQTDIYQPYQIPFIKTGFDLTFSALPEPTPGPTATPQPATPTPVPVPTEVVPPTPEIAEPMVFVSGLVFIRGRHHVPADSVLVARIGERYQSEPAAAISAEGIYGGLVVDPGDTSFEGAEIRFILDGIVSRTTAVYESGRLERSFDILFTDYPTPLPTHTAVPVDTATPIPTNTPVPTATAVPPTNTPVPMPTQPPAPTATPIPTNTPVPPVIVPVSAPSPSPEPPQVEPTTSSAPNEEESGGCFAAANVSPLTGAANSLLLIAPLGVIFGLRSASRSRRRR